jgi:cell division protein FtsB
VFIACGRLQSIALTHRAVRSFTRKAKGIFMSELEVQSAAASVAGLTQMQRVTDTFVAPSKTFEDINRGNRSWWMPLIIASLASYILFGAITQKIGMQQMVDNQMRMNPKAQEKLSELTPEQRATQTKVSVISTEVIFLASPVFSVAAAAIASLVLLGTINFIFGGKAKFSSVMAVWFYSWLPGVIKVLLGVVVIYAGETPESFNVKNFAPTNAGAFLDPVETNKALYALATSVDAVTIWMLILLSIGIATVAGVKRSSGYIAVFGWWAIITLVGVGWAAIMG